MKYIVAIKKEEYTDEFCFETEAERDEFIQVTREMHDKVEFLLTDKDENEVKVPCFAITA